MSLNPISAQDAKAAQDNRQHKAFVRWVNNNLSKVKSSDPNTPSPSISDLSTAFVDGVALCQLAQVLTGKQIRFKAKPNSELLEQTNISDALVAIDEDGCTLVNIWPTTLNKGNLHMTMGMVWQLIQYYTLSTQLGDDGPAPAAAPATAAAAPASPLVANKPARGGVVFPAKKQHKTLKGYRTVGRTSTVNMIDVKRAILEFINEQFNSLSAQEKAAVYSLAQLDQPDAIVCTDLDKQWQNGIFYTMLLASVHPAGHSEAIQRVETQFEDEVNNHPDNERAVSLVDAALLVAKNDLDIPKLMDGVDTVQAVDVNTNVTYLSYYVSKALQAPASPKQQEDQQQTEQQPPVEPVVEPVVDEAPVVVDAPEPEVVQEVVEDAPVEVEELPPVEQKIEAAEEAAPEPQPEPVVEPRVVQEGTPVDEHALLVREVSAVSNLKLDHASSLANLQQISAELTTLQREQDLDALAKKRIEVHKARISTLVNNLQQQASTAAPQYTPPSEQKQKDLQMYLILALIVAILAFLLK